MSWTIEWMRDWLGSDPGRRTQTELAAIAGADPANVSRWLNGQSKPERDVIERLLPQLDDDEATRLATAWLRDQLPDSASRLVQILPAKPKIREATPAPTLPAGMSADLREKLAYFGRLALANPDVRKILDVCHDAAKRAHGG
jgi:transcriptional regulator with XRE-family HTH domain